MYMAIDNPKGPKLKEEASKLAYLYRIGCKIELHMDGFSSRATSIETSCLVKKMIIKLTPQASPWILCFPD